MENSSKFFANKDCEYYPCHTCDGEINCLFCFCPLYDRPCPGNPKMTEKDGRVVKSCIDCIFPHKPENYQVIISILKQNQSRGEK